MADVSHRWPNLPQSARNAANRIDAADDQAERQRIYDTARQSGYEAGIAAGEQAARSQVAARTEQIEQVLLSVRNELQQWREQHCQLFTARLAELLKILAVRHIEAADGFYEEFLQEVAQEFDVEAASLSIQVGIDYEKSVVGNRVIVVDPTLAASEIRVSSGPRVARLVLDQLIERVVSVPEADLYQSVTSRVDVGSDDDQAV